MGAGVAAKSSVGTGLLLKLAQVFSDMISKGTIEKKIGALHVILSLIFCLVQFYL